MIPTQGHLRVHVITAELDLTLKIGYLFHYMRPFVQLKVGQLQNWQSTVCMVGNMQPSWPEGEFMDIEVRHIGEQITINCYDEKLGLIGGA